MAKENSVEQPARLPAEMLQNKKTTKAMLKAFCRQRGLADDGKKGRLIKRLLGLGDGAFSFPTKVRCPRCKSLQTRAYSTNENTQYRECLVAVCRWRFSVRGKPV